MSNGSFRGYHEPGVEYVPCMNPIVKKEILIRDVPLQGQVFGLHLQTENPPFHRKKLSNKEIREAIDRYELWFYVPSWQVPRVGTYRQFENPITSGRDVPMKKIICMAKRNETLDGNIGRLKFVFPHFGKRQLKKSCNHRIKRRRDHVN